jgi:hypothetical protein
MAEEPELLFTDEIRFGGNSGNPVGKLHLHQASQLLLRTGREKAPGGFCSEIVAGEIRSWNLEKVVLHPDAGTHECDRSVRGALPRSL